MGENQDRKQVEAAGQLHLNRKRFSGPIKNRIHWFVQLIVPRYRPHIGGAFVFWDPATVAHVGRVMPSRWSEHLDSNFCLWHGRDFMIDETHLRTGNCIKTPHHQMPRAPSGWSPPRVTCWASLVVVLFFPRNSSNRDDQSVWTGAVTYWAGVALPSGLVS
ncbi:hypothetical protein PAPYR_13145 [Paratrimastix pyriformis]|uniref:Uncharacterized protein n=1 Tax=Paratrimastix pyriformis TaxID=342808 RepID=A0ABQ8U0T4_9EUKA|nr:hypothetical protein PAPYR_13145 [Paratrimastix pyriformis]